MSYIHWYSDSAKRAFSLFDAFQRLGNCVDYRSRRTLLL